jgi:hypothetical protein
MPELFISQKNTRLGDRRDGHSLEDGGGLLLVQVAPGAHISYGKNIYFIFIIFIFMGKLFVLF